MPRSHDQSLARTDALEPKVRTYVRAVVELPHPPRMDRTAPLGARHASDRAARCPVPVVRGVVRPADADRRRGTRDAPVANRLRVAGDDTPRGGGTHAERFAAGKPREASGGWRPIPPRTTDAGTKRQAGSASDGGPASLWFGAASSGNASYAARGRPRHGCRVREFLTLPRPRTVLPVVAGAPSDYLCGCSDKDGTPRVTQPSENRSRCTAPGAPCDSLRVRGRRYADQRLHARRAASNQMLTLRKRHSYTLATR
jgi:hypothetical protein